jgi:hypothetical protein
MRRGRSVFALLAAAAMLAVTAHAAASRPGGASAARLGGPVQLSPAAGARLQAVPSFSWKRVRGAARYEFQLSADRAFESIVLGERRGSFQTENTYATIDKALADGTYYWRVRAIGAHDQAGRWSSVRVLDKAWTDAPVLTGAADGQAVTYPSTPLVLRWAPVPNAFKYVVRLATDPALATSALGTTRDVQTSGTAFALPGALAPGRYYWAVTPLDAERHPGTRSRVGSFDWSWPTSTTATVTDLDADARVFDPQFSWNPVAGAAQYQVEVNSSEDFATGSRVCCDDAVTGTSLSPQRLLPNNRYFWRVRAVDIDGNAGTWNAGPTFTKGFDDVVPTIPGLRVRDNAADATPAVGASGLPTTDAPVLTWDPVAGASSYELAVAPWEQPTVGPGFCNWTAGTTRARTFTTAATAWTPLAPTNRRPNGNAFTQVANESRFLQDGVDYCARVRARSDRDARSQDIVSEWTQLGGLGHAAFTYRVRTLPPCASTTTPAAAYHGPQQGSTLTRMPLFTWDWVDGACGYFVVVARDASFTKIVDLAFTTSPAYSPRTSITPTTYPDETTSYYWEVIPTVSAAGDGADATDPAQNHPQSFEKRSAPPVPLAPAAGADVTTQPAFRWQRAEGAREYRIQVADDPTFGSPLTDVVTDATAYTSTSALPADTALYWRVRANDENRTGLTWSATSMFRRRLPVPAVGDNPQSGETVPVLSWSPVEGAVSYDMHVEQADGTKRDFTMRSTAFTPVIFYGTGVWHWQVRASFRSGGRAVTGGYFGPQPFARHIATPVNLKATKANGGIRLAWDPAVMAARYKVQISTSDSFSTVAEQVTTSNTSFAPRMTHPAFASGAQLYWRVAVLDEGHNVGGWATAPLRNAKASRMKVKGTLRAGRNGRVAVTVTDASRHPLKGAVVRASGAGVSSPARRTNGRGRVTLRLTPRQRGSVAFSAAKPGYAPARANLRVR